MDALRKLLRKRDFGNISIQQISDEADLTRATFYLHYSDKEALLQAMTTDCFGKALKKRGVASPTREGGLRAIGLNVCEYLAKASNCPSGLSKMPLERSVIPMIEGMFREVADELRLAPGVDLDTFATAIACAIYGAASRWAQTPNRKPAEQMAQVIETLVKPLLQSVLSAPSR
jgi:AcrR family transcriptional regulator